MNLTRNRAGRRAGWYAGAIALAWPLIGAAAGGTPLDLGTPIRPETLAQQRGGHELRFNNMDLDASLPGNQALANRTGDNRVTSSAFSGASGIPTVIQNSGNNVIIQNATIVNVDLQ